MAKCRHRIFEMYEFRDEAIVALTPKAAHPVQEATDPKPWTFKHLAVSRSASMTHVKFKGAESIGEVAVSELREDFAQLAERLVRDSRVLMDFADVTSFCPGSVDVLVLFNQKLQYKGSRIVLCCVAPAARNSFFAARSR